MWCQSTSSTALRAVPTLETERPGRSVPCSRVAGLSCAMICSTSSLTWCAVPLLRRKSAFWPSPIRTSALWEMMGIDSFVISLCLYVGQRSNRGVVASATTTPKYDARIGASAPPSYSLTDGTQVSLLPPRNQSACDALRLGGQYSKEELLC